jgi:hypothetical protein
MTMEHSQLSFNPTTMNNEEGDSTTVQDDTDLTTCVGPGRRYKNLVKNCFTNEADGNVTWDAAKTFSMEGFLSNFDEKKPPRRASLQGWIAYYSLKDRFENEAPKDGKAPCCFVFVYLYSAARW